MIIIFTAEQRINGETTIINKLFEGGLQILHLRKPSFSFTECKEFLKRIDEAYHNRIMLHQHHGLSELFDVKGMHLKEHHRTRLGKLMPDYVRYLRESEFEVSTGFHNIDELHKNESLFDYVFLSPVYDSISKKGYRATPFDTSVLEKGEKNIVALGGINNINIAEVFESGFDGAAVMGAIWKSEDPIKAYIKLLSSSGMLCAILNKKLLE